MDLPCEDAGLDTCHGTVDVYHACPSDGDEHLESLCAHHATKRGYFSRGDAPRLTTDADSRAAYAATLSPRRGKT